uniref:Uncharacterized protein n=2 Tax=Kalanchoe fedtschenkoi TaxID=63787 RepID=A0A7N0UP98_KALFE
MALPLCSSYLLPAACFKHTRQLPSTPTLKCPCYQHEFHIAHSSLNGTSIKLGRGSPSRFTAFCSFKMASNEPVFEDKTLSFDLEDQGEIEDRGSPWEGAIVYKRNSSVSHVEYCTTLERLGLATLSTQVSKAKASNMGLRITKAVSEYSSGTPVQVSIDVTRKIQKLRLDGIIKTVLTLGCNRCGEAAAESIFSNFSLILSENPVEEPDVITFGLQLAEGNFSTSKSESSDREMEDEDAMVDLDDWLYFPREEKEIDISKHIRDLLHIEITISAVCDPDCKGLCLKCGVNLNNERCECVKQKKRDSGYGPLGNLRNAL